MTRLEHPSVYSKLARTKMEFKRLLDQARFEQTAHKAMKAKFEDLIAQSKGLENFLLIKQNHDVGVNSVKLQPKGLRARRRVQKLKRLCSKEESEEDIEAVERFDLLETQPSNLKGGTLKPYQMEGLNWMISLFEIGANGILADQMGLGKTIQTIGLLAYLLERIGKGHKYLIIAPTSVVGNWHRELRKWLPAMKSVRLNPRKEARSGTIELYVRPQNFDILITSYEAVSICKKHLKRISWKYIIVDEAHRLKNEESKFSKSIRELKTQSKLLITGTPLQNNVHELWALLNFLMPEMFGDSEMFDQPIETTKKMSKDEKEEANLEFIQRLHHVLRPFILKRCKATLDLGLPEKKEIQLHIGMTPMQTEIYKRILLSEPINEQVCGYSNVLMQLRKVCNHPYLFEGVEPDNSDPFGEHLVEASGKLIVLDKLLTKLHAEHKVLIFSQFRSLLDILEDYLRIRKFEYCRFDGTTMQEDRERAIDEFRNPTKNKFVFLLSTRAGGLGINLTAADTVVLFDSDWNPQVDLQAIDRAHRIGQTREVRVYRLICEKTIEEKIIERQVVKMKWDQLVILKGKISQKQIDYGKEELKDLISYGSGDIFKSEGGAFKDEDIETLLARGEAKSKELEAKVDKILEKTRDAVLELGVEAINVFDLAKEEIYDDEDRRFIEQKRMQKAYSSVGDNPPAISRQDDIANRNQAKPRPKLLDFHYFGDRERYSDLLLIDKDDLTIGQAREKASIQARSFRLWTSFTFNQFIKAFEKEENPDPTNLSTILKKPQEQVNRMISRFWTEIVFLDEHSKILERLYKGQEKRRAQAELINSVLEKSAQVTDFDRIILRSPFYSRVKNKMFLEALDKFLIFSSSEIGKFDGELLRQKVKSDPHFRYNFIARGLKSNVLSRRALTLARVCLNEIKTIMNNREAGQEDLRPREHFSRQGFANGANPGFGRVGMDVRDLNEVFMRSNDLKMRQDEERAKQKQRAKKKKFQYKQFFMTTYLDKQRRYREMLIKKKHREIQLRKCGLLRQIVPMVHYEPCGELDAMGLGIKDTRKGKSQIESQDALEANNVVNHGQKKLKNVNLEKRDHDQAFKVDAGEISQVSSVIKLKNLISSENIKKSMADKEFPESQNLKEKDYGVTDSDFQRKTQGQIDRPEFENSKKRSNDKDNQYKNIQHLNDEIFQPEMRNKSQKIIRSNETKANRNEQNPKQKIPDKKDPTEIGGTHKFKKIQNTESLIINKEKSQKLGQNENPNQPAPEQATKIEIISEPSNSTMISRRIDVNVLMWNPERDEVAEKEQQLRHQQLMNEMGVMYREMTKIHEYTIQSRHTTDFNDPVSVKRRSEIIYRKMKAFVKYMDQTDPERLLFPEENLCSKQVNSPYYRLERNRQDDLETKIFIHFLKECCNRIPAAEPYIRSHLPHSDLTFLVTQMMQCHEVHQDNYLLEHVYSIRNQLFRRNYQSRCLRKLVEKKAQEDVTQQPSD